MSVAERAVIYVESGDELYNSVSSSSSSRPSSSQKTTKPCNNYVIKIQIGEEAVFNHPVRIDVAGSHHRRQMVRHLHEAGDESSLGSGQSSPRSDMTPPPRLNAGVNVRFGSETSESDTESDISSVDYQTHPTRSINIKGSTKKGSCTVVQFARRELLGMESGSIYAGAGSPNGNDSNSDDGSLQTILEGDVVVSTNDVNNTFVSLKNNLNKNLMKVFAQQEKTTVPPVQRHNDINPTVKPTSSYIPEKPLNGLQLVKSKEMLNKVPEWNSRPQSMIFDQTSFHLNELNGDGGLSKDLDGKSGKNYDSLTNFAGYKDIFTRTHREGLSQIMSDNGTIRGVKNRVRDGIATFLQTKDSKYYNEKEQGRVVVYVTSMGVVRNTYQRCQKVKQILRTLLIKFDERDCYMNRAVQDEIRERLPIEMQKKALTKTVKEKYDDNTNFTGLLSQNTGFSSDKNTESLQKSYIQLPQVFMEGQYLGDAELIEKLNETGELRELLRPYKSSSVLTTCQCCGGFRMLPCPVCNGSKKSVHRNHFTEEFVALKCMHCDQAGLIKCQSCNP